MQPSLNEKKLSSLAGFLVLCYAVAFTASLITRPSIPVWYAGLHRPLWAPPNWLFGPAWTVLYGMMAAAGWRIWRKEPSRRRSGALFLFGLQLTLNFSWSPVFFGLHQTGWGVVVLFLLWMAIGGFVVAARRTEAVAAALFVPYFLWVSYALALNFAIWRMN